MEHVGASESSAWKPRVVEWAGFALFVGWISFKVLSRVPWRDELQALVIARDSDNLIQLFHRLAYEGHPGLWYLILFCATRLSTSPSLLAWLQASVAIAILSLIWFRSPFGFVEKTLISASYYVSFEYGVIARAYGLGVVLLLGAIELRRSVWAWLLLGLMANVSAHFAMLAGLMGLLLLWRGQRSRIGMMVCAGLMGIAVITAWPASDVIPAVPQAKLPLVRAVLNLAHLSAALLPITVVHGATGYWDAILYEIGPGPLAGIGLAIPILGAMSLRQNPDLAACFLAFCVAMLSIGIAIFTGYDRHYGIVFILLIALHWIAREESISERRSIIFAAWLVLSAVAGVWTAYWSTGVPFSEGRALAHWVRDHRLQSQPWAAYPGAYGLSVSAYLGVPTYNVEAGRWNTFIRWDYSAEQPNVSPDWLASKLRSVPVSRFYLVSNSHWVAPSMVTALRARAVNVVAIKAFDDPGTLFPLEAYRVSIGREKVHP